MVYNKHYKIFILLFAICFTLFIKPPAIYAYSDLSEKISNIINNDSNVSRGAISVKVKFLNGPVIYSKNENKALIPASNMKIVTAVTALSHIGEKYKYKTTLYGGRINLFNGALYGPLILKGCGDPTWMGGFLTSPTQVLEEMADSLKSLGVKTIKGDLIADDLSFDRQYIPHGWKNEQECYTSPVSALALNSNQISVRVYGSKISVYPSCRSVNIVKKNKAGDLFVSRDNYSDTVFVNGNSSDYTRIIPVYSPALFTVSVFKEILSRKGIKVTGDVRLIQSYESFYEDKMYKWHENESCYLIDIIKQMNKQSDNFLAEQLFKTISKNAFGLGTQESSKEIIFDFCNKLGFNTKGIEIYDGSGLSLKDKISSALLINLLEYIYNSDYKKSFIETLPRGGIDGTLEYRLSGVPVYAKTGTLDGYSSLSGYVKTKKGQWVVFAIIQNNENCPNYYMKEVEDKIVRAIAEYNTLVDIEKVKKIIIE